MDLSLTTISFKLLKCITRKGHSLAKDMSPPKPSPLLLEMVELGELFLESPSPSHSPGSLRLLGLNGRDGLHTRAHTHKIKSVNPAHFPLQCVWKIYCNELRVSASETNILVSVDILVKTRCIALLLLLTVSLLFCREAILGLKIRVIILSLLTRRVCRCWLRAGSSEGWETYPRDRVL